MSFGLLKHFKDHKKFEHDQQRLVFSHHVILGHDLAAILRLIELKKTHPEANIRLISYRPLTKKLLIENYQYGVSQLRSEMAVTEIYKSHFNAKILPQKAGAQFYKDGKFHDFIGRAKSMELLNGENFFIQKGYQIDISSLFSQEDWNNLDETLKLHSEVRIIEGIEKTEPRDLIEKAEWTINFKDFSRISCESLYLSQSPKKFLSLLKNKEKLVPELIDFCSSVEVQGALSVTWKLSKELMRDERTLFIPQSMTHEWGHFIFEFENYNYQDSSQLCHALFLIHEDELQSEDLAGKIKLLKRVFDRVFPDFENLIQSEYIRFDEEMLISGIKDSLLEQIGFDYPTLKFLGQSSPMIPQFFDQKFLARVLLS